MHVNKCYIISYEPKRSSDISAFREAIKAYGTWARITEFTWAIVTDVEAAEIREHLADYIKKGERLFIVRSGGESAWRNSRCRNEWLKDNL